eukprot:1183631-Prorocentrum_minimum.AAC.1
MAVLSPTRLRSTPVSPPARRRPRGAPLAHAGGDINGGGGAHRGRLHPPHHPQTCHPGATRRASWPFVLFGQR